MPGKKMMPSLPDTLGGSEHDRFVTFAKTILADPRSKVMPEHTLVKLEAEKQIIEGKIIDVRREIAKHRRPRTKV